MYFKVIMFGSVKTLSLKERFKEAWKAFKQKDKEGDLIYVADCLENNNIRVDYPVPLIEGDTKIYGFEFKVYAEPI